MARARCAHVAPTDFLPLRGLGCGELGPRVTRFYARIFVIISIFAFSADFHDFLENKLATPSLGESGERANPCSSRSAGRASGSPRREKRDTLQYVTCQLAVLSYYRIYYYIHFIHTVCGPAKSPAQTQAAREVHRLSPFATSAHRDYGTPRWLSLRPTAVIGSSSLCLLWQWGPSGRRRAKSRTSLPW